MSAAVDSARADEYAAFYSSTYGGITTNPGLMFIPIDDHFVHKGHGTYEHVFLKDGHLYMLDQRIERLKQSAEVMGLSLPYSEPALKRLILDTAAASRKKNGEGREHQHRRRLAGMQSLTRALVEMRGLACKHTAHVHPVCVPSLVGVHAPNAPAPGQQSGSCVLHAHAVRCRQHHHLDHGWAWRL